MNLLNLVIIMLTIIILIASYTFVEWKDYEKTSFNSLDTTITVQQSSLNEWITFRLNAIRLLASLAVMTQDRLGLSKVFQLFLQQYSDFSSIMFVDTGSVLVANAGIPVPPDLVQTLSRQAAGDVGVGKLYDEPVVIFSSPVYDNNERYTGTIIAATKAKYLSSRLQNFNCEKAAETLLSDENGFVFAKSGFAGESARPAKLVQNLASSLMFAGNTYGIGQMKNGSSGTDYYTDQQGIAVLGAYRPIPERRWTIATQVNRTEILASFISRATLTISAFILSILSAAPFIHAVTSRIVSPLKELAAHARQFRLSGYSIAKYPRRRNHLILELYELDCTLERMAGALIEKQDKLQAATSDLAITKTQYHMLLENCFIGVYTIHNDVLAYVNPYLANLFGYTPEEVIGKTPLQFFIPEHHLLVKENINKQLAGEVLTTRQEYTGVKKDGSRIFVEILLGKCIINTTGDNGPAIIGTVRDVTEQKLLNESLKKMAHELEILVDERTSELNAANQSLLAEITERLETEKQLRVSEQRFAKLFHANPMPTLIARVSDGLWIDANDSFLRLMGLTREKAIGGAPTYSTDILASKQERQELINQLVTENQLHCQLHCLKKTIRTVSGKERTVQISAEPITLSGSNEPYILYVFNDITEQLHLQKELARLDRLNLIGEMAVGIGHEVRNPMTTVRGFLQMLMRKDATAKYNSYYSIMIEELDQANAIITEFLSLAKNRSVNLQPMNLNTLIAALASIIQADPLMNGKSFSLNLDDIPDVLLDEKEIRQLILNLARNGLEAMEGSGELTITTFSTKERVIMAIADQGPGISADALDKLGTPFFSTKDQATGLGIAVCYSIAAKHEAELKFYTSPQGTTVQVRFKKMAIRL
ncbi:PAS domain S-box protein [Methylomusa anaerophila]|uniref:PAS domain S-box protein n=1 Tax=Methylomusa anaerophila TaxID=1930071 RepID=UPI001E3D2E8B|nr:PAS domain S-box protein [Methylomusa anaerophila]